MKKIDSTPNFEEIAKWAADLYEERTRDLVDGKLSMYYVHPSYRVTTHEIMKQFNLNLAPWMIEFHTKWKKEMKRRGLLKVMEGKMKSDEWCKLYPKTN